MYYCLNIAARYWTCADNDVRSGVVLRRGYRYRKVNKWCQCRKLRVTARSQVREFSDLGVIAMPSDDSRGNATGHGVR